MLAAFSLFRACLAMIILFTALVGLAYPLAVTGVAQLAFPHQANGSLITDKADVVVGSVLIAQGFTRPEYLHPRPSSAGANGYDATSSSGSNLGPMDQKEIDAVAANAKSIAGEGSAMIPADAVTASASGLDPDISPENAFRQAARIASARHARLADVQGLIAGKIADRTLFVLGERRVNVLSVNRALDQRFPLPTKG